MKKKFNASNIRNSKSSDILIDFNNEGYIKINLIKLIQTKSIFIVLITLLCALCAFAYTYTIKPQYKVTTHIAPPEIKQLQNLYLNTNSRLNQADLFQLFLNKLSNQPNFDLFLKNISSVAREQSLPTIDKIKYKVIPTSTKNSIILNQDYKVVPIQSTEADLTIFSPEIDKDAFLNKAYIDFTNNEVLTEIAKIQSEIMQLQAIQAIQQKKIDLKLLIEQKSLVITKLINTLNRLKNKKSDSVLKRNISFIEKNLFHVEYEMEVLKLKNKSNNSLLNTLSSGAHDANDFSFDISGIKTYKISGEHAFTPIKPNGKKSILLGLLFGFIISVMIVILQTTLKIRKELNIYELKQPHEPVAA